MAEMTAERMPDKPEPGVLAQLMSCVADTNGAFCKKCAYTNYCGTEAMYRDAAEHLSRMKPCTGVKGKGVDEIGEFREGILKELEAVRDAWDASRLNGNGDVAKGIKIAINRITGIQEESYIKSICKGNGMLCRRCTEKCGFRVEVKYE